MAYFKADAGPKKVFIKFTIDKYLAFYLLEIVMNIFMA